MNGFGLDDYLEVMGLQKKLEHDYVDLQKRLANANQPIQQIVEYCFGDVDALFRLNEATSILDKVFGLIEILGLPLSAALYQTDKNNIEQYLQQQYTRLGYAVCYTESGELQQTGTTGFDGAYCETFAQPCQAYSEVICPDFASLYPSALMSMNACLTTIDKDGEIIVDTSDDSKLGLAQVRFNRGNAVISGLMKTMFEKRKQYKRAMVEQPHLRSKFDCLQLTTKLVLNTTYGLLGSSLSPLFYKPMAAAVTAYGRKCTRTARDFMIAQGHTVLFCDTDSIFSQLSVDVQDWIGI